MSVNNEPIPIDESRMTGPVGADAQVVLSLPVEPDWLALARTTCAGVAARADFTYDEIADLRLAIDELCLSLLEQSDANEVMEVRYKLAGGSIWVEARVSGIANGKRPASDASSEFSKRILDALVDDHGQDPAGRMAWFAKQRGLGPS